jgi:hypothetical protein
MSLAWNWISCTLIMHQWCHVLQVDEEAPGGITTSTYLCDEKHQGGRD